MPYYFLITEKSQCVIPLISLKKELLICYYINTINCVIVMFNVAYHPRSTVDLNTLHVAVKMAGFCSEKSVISINHGRIFSTLNVSH